MADKPDKYHELHINARLDSISGMAKQGAAHQDIAREIGVPYAQFKRWRKKYPQFDAALSSTPALSDGELYENAHKQSVGYFVEEDKAVKIKTCMEIAGQAQQVEAVEVVKLRRYIPPNFILRNRLGVTERDTDIVIRAQFEGDLDDESK